MQLLYQTHSPYARKVLVMAHECGLASQLEVVHHETSPTRRNDVVYAANPLGKVPVLLFPDGTALFDSLVICDYLDGLHRGLRLIPREGARRYAVLRLHALAQGLCDVGIKLRWEVERRPAALRYPAYAEGQASKLAEAFHFLEGDACLEESETLGHIALATALDWLVFRHLADLAAHPRLHAWYQAFCQRPSMQATPYLGHTQD